VAHCLLSALLIALLHSPTGLAAPECGAKGDKGQCKQPVADDGGGGGFPSSSRVAQVTGRRLQALLAVGARGSRLLAPPAAGAQADANDGDAGAAAVVQTDSSTSYSAPAGSDSANADASAADADSAGDSELERAAASAVVVLFFLDRCPNSM
jgi:hypothetical protein